jgi:hypothetical protein
MITCIDRAADIKPSSGFITPTSSLLPRSLSFSSPPEPMSSSESTSFILEGPPTHDSDDVDSLPSTDDHSSLDDGTELDSDAEREWRESLQQIELLLTMVVVPYLGKYFGRKCAYWGELLQVLTIGNAVG